MPGPRLPVVLSDPRPAQPYYAEAPECEPCTWTPLPACRWQLRFVYRACWRHAGLLAPRAPYSHPAVNGSHHSAPPRPGSGRPGWLPAARGLARCPVPACPMRDAPGHGRPCPLHGDTLSDDGEGTYATATPDGRRDGDPARHDGDAALARQVALLRPEPRTPVSD